MRWSEEYRTPPQLMPLLDYLRRIPTIVGLAGEPDRNIAGGFFQDRRWWVIFRIKIEDQLAWHVVGRLAEILNDISSSDEAFPSSFMPIVAPYANSTARPPVWWIIESKHAALTATDVIELLEARLPQPLEDVSQWLC